MSTGPERMPRPSAQPSTAPAAESPDLLDEIVRNTRVSRDKQQRETFELGLYELARELESGTLSRSYMGDLEGLINAAIGQIDTKLSTQVDLVIHHPKFQKLEATWRSLHRLVEESFNRTEERHREEIKIKVLNATRRDLERDLRVGTPRRPIRPVFSRRSTSRRTTRLAVSRSER